MTKSVTIRFKLDQLKKHVEEARARGLDLSTYLRAKLEADADHHVDFHSTKKDKKS